MKRRRRRDGIWPVDLPKVRDDQIRIIRTVYSDDPFASTVIRALTEGDMWWVSAPMTALAWAAAPDLPSDQTAERTRPTLGGVLIWEGGTGITAQFKDAPAELWTGRAFGNPQPPLVDIVGVCWTPGPNGPLILGLTNDQHVREHQHWDGLFPIAPDSPGLLRLEAMLISTWLLADQPSIGTRRRYDPRTAGMHARKIPHDSEVQIIKLREHLTHPEAWPGEDTDTPEERRWQLTHRILVSGHWRQQPCGPGRADRRPIFVPPHIKGPPGAPLVVKPRVKVWSR